MGKVLCFRVRLAGPHTKHLVKSSGYMWTLLPFWLHMFVFFFNLFLHVYPHHQKTKRQWCRTWSASPGTRAVPGDSGFEHLWLLLRAVFSLLRLSVYRVAHRLGAFVNAEGHHLSVFCVSPSDIYSLFIQGGKEKGGGSNRTMCSPTRRLYEADVCYILNATTSQHVDQTHTHTHTQRVHWCIKTSDN